MIVDSSYIHLCLICISCLLLSSTFWFFLGGGRTHTKGNELSVAVLLLYISMGLVLLVGCLSMEMIDIGILIEAAFEDIAYNEASNHVSIIYYGY